MNRKLSLVIVIALLALLALTVSASGVIAREAAPPDKVIAQPPVAQCTADPQVARVRVLGRVFDEQGIAREGLHVQAIGQDGTKWGETRTQAGGRYSLPSLPAGQYTLRVLDERRRPMPQADDAEVVAAETQQWVKRDLFLASSKASLGPMGVQQTGQITGVVTASDTVLPLSNVDVWAYDAATGSFKGVASTDSNGQYTIGSLATGTYKVEFDAPYGSDYVSPQWYSNKTDQNSATPINVTDGVTTTNINAVMQLGGQITGRVTAADTHNSLQDVSVSVSGYFSGTGCSNYWSGYATTDANGVYTVTAIPTGSGYKVNFDPSSSSTALTQEYLEQYYNQADSSHATPVGVTAPNVVHNIDAALLRGGQIKGLVTGQGSVGLPDVDVTATGAGYGSATTDATGAYTITGLLSGTYKVEFSPSPYGASKDYAYQFYNTKSTRSTANSVNVTAPSVTPNINQVLPLGSRITGQVTTADTHLSVQNASIYVYDSDGVSVSSDSTNATGVYTTTTALPTGNYRIEFDPSYTLRNTYTWQYYNNKLTLSSADVLSVTAPNLVTNTNAALARGGQISGTITSADTSLPLQSIYVNVYDSNGSSVAYASSDATGAYLTPALPPGNYRVWFGGRTIFNPDCSTKCYAGQYYNNKPDLASATPVSVVASQVTKNISAILAICSTGPTPPSSVDVSGPVTGTAFSNIAFSATVNPSSATTPITYTWQATDKSPVTHTGGGTSDTIYFIWSMTGTKAITVTATNALGSATNSRTITIEPSNIVFDHWIYLPAVMRQ